MNRRQDKRLIIVETAIYRVFVMIYRVFCDDSSEYQAASQTINRTGVGL
ncbi:MAG: hypothetical protein V7L22_20330 [Nostoc sp.]